MHNISAHISTPLDMTVRGMVNSSGVENVRIGYINNFYRDLNRFFSVFIICALLFVYSCRSKGPNNPYLKLKKKPSDYIRKENANVLEKSTKQQRKMLKRNKRNVYRN